MNKLKSLIRSAQRRFTKLSLFAALALTVLALTQPAQAIINQYTFAADAGCYINALGNNTITFGAASNVVATLGTNGLTLGAATNTPSFTLVLTNWVDGATYTNATGRNILVSTPCKITRAATVGVAAYAVQVPGQGTNYFSDSTTGSSLVTSATNQVQVFVPNGSTFVFTNVSTSTDTAAIVAGGSYIVF